MGDATADGATVTVEDRVLIRELYSRLFWAHNRGDGPGILACFAPGGYATNYAGEKRTPEMSVDTAGGWASDPNRFPEGTRQHHITNLIVDPDESSDDRRRVRIYFFITEIQQLPNSTVRWSGRSDDLVQKIDGEWKFLHRQISLNHPDAG